MIGWWAFAATGTGYALLALVLAALGRHSRQARLFALTALVHAAWAASLCIPATPAAVSGSLHTAHFGMWAIFLAGLFPDRRATLPRLAVLGSLAAIAARILLETVDLLPELATARLSLTVNLIAVVLALVTLTGIFQAAGESERWSLKFICFPLGGVFAYDLFLLAHALAVAPPGREYLEIRGVLDAIAVPLVFVAAYRQKFWRREFHISRQAAVYSLTLIAVGLYLLLVAAAGTLLQYYSGTATGPMQAGLLFLALLLLLFLLSSGRTRAKIKLLVGRHFFARKYDYAHEWRKFMQTIALEAEVSPLENRIIRACADVLEVPGGALWAIEDGRAQLRATWNYRPVPLAARSIETTHFQDRDGAFRCLYGPRLQHGPLAADAKAWIVIPLPHGRALAGFVVLSQPRAEHELDREDEELLLLVARQCASFLAEHRATVALEQARQFDRFNRQYAFVTHDVKNVISQLSLMLRNFERHAANPDFQRDMHQTVANAVERMQKLVDRLKRLADGDPGIDTPELLCVYDLLGTELVQWREQGMARLALSSGERARDARVYAPRERLRTMMGHLVANAAEAGGTDGRVGIHLDRIGRELVIDIVDEGPGMTPEFIDTRLFVPFSSTKRGGLGIGAFQCREFAREMGGEIEAISSPGSGTTMRLRLPVATKADTPGGVAAR